MVKKPVRSIVAAIAAAATRWSDARFPPRVRARDAVGTRAGYSPGPSSMRSIASLARCVATRSRRSSPTNSDASTCSTLCRARRAAPRVRLTDRPRLRLSSHTTIGVAIVPAIFALCAKCDVLVKDREDHLVSAFFATLADELPELSASAAAMPWNGERSALDLSGFAAVVAFAADATLAEIGEPTHRRTLFHTDPRHSAGYVPREALRDSTAAREAARGAATDLLLYETEGCLSLHALFVERGGGVSPERFAQLLADAVAAVSNQLGVGRLDQRRVARLALARDMVAFRAGSGTATLSDPESTYLLVMDPPWDEPPPFIDNKPG